MRARCLIAVLVAAAASLAAGVALSLAYWGYAFGPPAVLHELREARALHQISWVGGLSADDQSKLSIRPVGVLPSESELRWNTDSELFAPDRIVRTFLEAGLSPETGVPVASSLAIGLWQAAEERGLLLQGSPDYRFTKQLRGYVGLVTDARGERLAFAGALGNEESNDHYPYYEIVVSMQDGKPVLQSSQSYFVDIAGIEGATYWVFALLLFFPAVLVALFSAGAWHGLRS